MKVEMIARVCHEVNKAYCEANGDFSQKRWEETEEWRKESTIKGVQFALSADPTPAEQHEAWVNEKLASGWLYGSHKDVIMKKHPYIVPYEQLPAIEKTKDHLFVAVVKSLKAL